MPRPKLSLKARALKFLSAREHSRSELRAKLLRPPRSKAGRVSRGRGDDVAETAANGSFPDATSAFEAEHFDTEYGGHGSPRDSEQSLELAAEVDAVLDELERLKYLSDARFVESLAHRRAGSFGVLKLRHELKAHRIAEPLVRDVLDQARDTELERAALVWSRKFTSLPESMADRARQQRFLAGRGFSPSVISKVLKGRVLEQD